MAPIIPIIALGTNVIANTVGIEFTKFGSILFIDSSGIFKGKENVHVNIG
jgi:hypothetical protein